MASREVHDMAKVGFGEGTNELYDRARPTYPSPSLDFMRAKLTGNGPFNIVEIGSGTGLFTRTLLAHPQWKDCVGKIHAVEPSPGMRQTFQAKTQDDRISVADGTFTQTGEKDNWADAVVVAQAFHWAHPNYDGAMAEIARILKPNGTAFFIWNMEDRDSARWVARVRELYESHEADTPQFRRNLWEEAFKTASYISSFHAPERFYTDWMVPTTNSGVQDRVLSKSYITALSEEEKKTLCIGIEGVLGEEEKTWIDQSVGSFQYPYKTTVIAMKRLS
ncbi:hypothetical protein M408DRAFT_132375 [Serendipita vermifera MAFF 305830]|uniref:Methyltransferase type 11 domain-containing protein n=1 Tax=Serendipita vermifera MAFF 305830 TaxID=933852 RepID=A0A0C3AW55_SERVB|nr:hypothetical protein M408DRAFT_132375 [Serendipita vermifera MAFF 305830]